MEDKLQDVKAQIWDMANQLRGSMDASEYKNYILPLLFYRYLSERQEKFLLENDLLELEEGMDANDAYVEQVGDEDLNDFLEEISASLGYAIKPEHTWKSLVKKIYDKKVIPSDYQEIFDSFNANAKLNVDAEKDFRGVFNDVNLGDSRLGTTTVDRAKSLGKIVTLVDTIQYKNDSGKDVLGEIYEFLIGQFAANAGKKGGEFYTPHEVSRILAGIVTSDLEDNDDTFSVYDPTSGSGSLLLTVGADVPGGDQPGKVKYYGQEKNTTTYNLCRMNLMMHGVDYKNMSLSNADTLEADWPDGVDAKGIDRPRFFDAVVANPPYSANWDNSEGKLKDIRFKPYGKLAPKTKADFAFVLHGLYHLNNEGVMAVVLPHGVLFRGAAEGTIRKNLIDKNQIDAVIGLPANLFYGTSIPTIVLVLKKNKTTKDILFIDASKDFKKVKNKNQLTEEHIEKILKTYKDRQDLDKYAHVASIKEIRDNDYNLNIPRYVDSSEDVKEVDLKEVLTRIYERNQEIQKAEASIFETMSQLTGVDDLMDILNKLRG